MSTSHVIIKYYDGKTGAVKLLHQTVQTSASNPLSAFETNLCKEGQTILYATCHSEGAWNILGCGLCKSALAEASGYKPPPSNEQVDDAKQADGNE
jgi:hypothetical protein